MAFRGSIDVPCSPVSFIYLYFFRNYLKTTLTTIRFSSINIKLFINNKSFTLRKFLLVSLTPNRNSLQVEAHSGDWLKS